MGRPRLSPDRLKREIHCRINPKVYRASENERELTGEEITEFIERAMAGEVIRRRKSREVSDAGGG